MNRNRFIQGLKSDIQFSEKERQRIIRNSIKKYLITIAFFVAWIAWRSGAPLPS